MAAIKPSKLNTFTFFKLPAAWWTGVRVQAITKNTCTVTVKHGWRNQNPFQSMFWAVQGMAAELSTGALVMTKIKEHNKKISMLVANNNATFTKKATGKITFVCTDGELLDKALEKTITTGEGVTVWMKAIGTNADGVQVSEFNFEWTLKVKV